MNHFILLSLALISLLSLPACAGSTQLFIGLTSDKPVYHTGEPIAVALTVLNRGTQPYQTTFSSGLKYDFILSDPSDKEVWRWSRGKMFTQAFTKITLEPGTPQTWVVVIEPKVLPTGKYRLTAILKATENPFQTEPIAIEIK